jgi:hypothetical protein
MATHFVRRLPRDTSEAAQPHSAPSTVLRMPRIATPRGAQIEVETPPTGAASPVQPAAVPAATGTTSTPIGALAVQLSEWIPTETIAVYVAVIALVGDPNWPTAGCSFAWPSLSSADFFLWFAVSAGAISSPALVYWLAKVQARTQGKAFAPPAFPMFASLAAFVAWADYLPNSIIQHCLLMPTYGPGFVLIATQFALWITALSLKADGKLDIDPSDPIISDSERDGSILSLPNGKPHVKVNDAVGAEQGTPVPVQGDAAYVLASANIVPVFLGDAWLTGDPLPLRAKCRAFIAEYIKCPTFGALSIYGVQSATIRLPELQRPFDQASKDDDAIQGALQSLIADGSVLPPYQNTLVMFFTPPGLRIQGPSGLTCVGSCGYHQMSRYAVPYAVIPYVDAQCDACKANGRSDIDAMMSEICHELCEAVSNPNPFDPLSNGWKTPDGDEIADQCQYTNTVIAGYNIQRIYINGSGCV